MADIGPLEAQYTLESHVIAHRGNISEGVLPDNSLPALRQAIQARIPFLEVDVRRSTDGALFLFHDGSFSRWNSYAPSHLRGIPIGTVSSDDRSQVSLDSSGTIKIPSLADALSLIEQYASATPAPTLQLDLKGESDDLLLAVLQLVHARGLLHRVLLQLRTPERINLALTNYPNARILARCKTFEQLTQVLTYRIEAVELERWITSEAVRLAHDHGVRVAINVAGSRLDEQTTHDYLRSGGADMIMTDHAGHLSKVTCKSPCL